MRSNTSPSTGFSSIFQSPVCTMVPWSLREEKMTNRHIHRVDTEAQRHRHRMKPGLCGHAQCAPCLPAVPAQCRMQYDSHDSPVQPGYHKRSVQLPACLTD